MENDSLILTTVFPYTLTLVQYGIGSQLEYDCCVLFSQQGAETPAAGILEYGPPGYPSVGSPQAPLEDRIPCQCHRLNLEVQKLELHARACLSYLRTGGESERRDRELRSLGAFIATTTFIRDIGTLLQIRQFAQLRSTTVCHFLTVSDCKVDAD